MKKERLNTRKLTNPIPVNNVDGTPNEAGPISEIVDMVLCYKDHTEWAIFAVTSLGDQDAILGLPWLRKHNPEVDWRTEEVKMSCCPVQCKTCQLEIKEERHIRRIEARRIRACRAGPMPKATVEDVEDEEEEDVPEWTEMEEDEDDEEKIEEGDRIFAVNIGKEPENVRATGNFSQRLAEAFHRNEPRKDFRDAVPDYLHDFQDVFAKESYNALPDRKIWDHAIELVPDAQSSNCKIYPLSRDEQAEMDAFIEENLRTGRIQPSKSPMASPCFFIKKKDGKLRLIQDYRKLNGMTVKNRYPLPLISELVEKLRGAQYFTKLDVRWGYHNVRIKKGDEWKAAFRTNQGLFEPLVMMFGLTNSPATFQTMMNDIFQDLISEVGL